MTKLQKQILVTLKNYPSSGHIPEQNFRKALSQHTGIEEYYSNFGRRDDEVRTTLIHLDHSGLISLDTVTCEKGIGTCGNPKITPYGMQCLDKLA